MNIGEYIKKLRTEKDLTQEQLGNIIGVKRAAVQKWESGRTENLKRTTIVKLSEFFNVPPHTFIIEESEPTIDEQLDGISFALNSETKELTDEQKQDVLNFVRFIKSQNKGNE